MARRVIEALSGVGDIYAGDVLLRAAVPYRLSRWSDATPAGDSAAEKPAIDGHIDITGIAEAVVLAGPGVLTLRLDDHRRLPFALTGTGGEIVARGRLEQI